MRWHSLYPLFRVPAHALARARVCIPALVLAALAAGCPTVDLGDVPPDPGQCRPSRAYFDDVIWPELIAPADTARSCVDAAGCHRLDDGRSALRLTLPSGQADDQRTMDRNYDTVVRFLNCGAPESSTMLTKPMSGIDTHAGGDLFDPGSDQESGFLTWFAQ